MRKDIALILLILAILALIIVPLAPAFLDVLLSINLTLSVLLLIVAVYLKNPADFLTFPTVILLGTAYRLALSIATTRQILSEAEAGQIIDTFGSFVIGGNIAIGLIIFLIITVFQFLVITKGAERVAEVSARFALDALPGKQMSIDADLRAENIDKEAAAERREKLERESQFFGSMDGAMKFVKGDAIAGLIIIFINLVGGVTAGMLIHQFSFQQSVSTYTLLTLGDGLVAQLPALLMALCAGIVTTRIDGKENIDLGSDIWRDLVTDPRVPAAASGIVLLIGFIPGFPLINFVVAASVLFLVSLSVRRVLLAAELEEEVIAARAAPEIEETPGVRLSDADEPEEDRTPRSTRVTLRIGAGLAQRMRVSLIDQLLIQHFQSLERLRGLTLPPPLVQIIEEQPDLQEGFEIILDEVPLVADTVPVGAVLLPCEASFLDVIGCPLEDARETRWHDFHGFWLPQSFEETAAKAEVLAMQIEALIALTAFRVVESNVGVLFSHEQFENFLDHLSQSNPHQRQELDQKAESNTFYLTLRYLAEDGVPLRPAGLIVDSFLYWLMIEGNIGAIGLAERMRGSLKRQLCHSLSGGRRLLGAVLLDPTVEEAAHRAVANAGFGDSAAASDGLPFDMETSDRILGQFRSILKNQTMGDPMPIVVASTPLRRRLRNYLSANLIPLPVLAPHELSQEIQIHPVARIHNMLASQT